MQSIGHGGMHRSQPVHCDAMTVCIVVGAPTMQSTGQAWMHSVQPMHSVSSISATASGLSIPLAGFSGSGGRSQQFRQLRRCRRRRPVGTG